MFSYVYNQVATAFNQITNAEPWSHGADIFNGKFVDNELQRQHIKEIVTDFKQARDKVLAIDKKIGAALCIEGLLYMTGFLGTTSTAVLTIALLGYVFPYEKRNESAKEMKDKLDKLRVVYSYCLDSNSTSLIHNETFLSVLECIAPFVKTADLKLEKLNYSENTTSSRFTQILSQSPHRIQFILPDKQTLAEQIKHLSQDTQGWYGFFNQSKADLQRAAYGANNTEDLIRRLMPR